MVYCGVDIGGTNIKYGLVSEKGEIILSSAYCYDHGIPNEMVFSMLAKKILSLLKQANLEPSDVKGIGCGVPGSIDSKRGVCIYSNNIAFENLPIAYLLEKGTSIKAKITNDANAATLGEYRFGAGKDFSSVVMLTLGTGLGCGIILDGKLFEGNMGLGTELGHTIFHKDGLLCSCGRRGCAEMYVSARALQRRANEAYKEADVKFPKAEKITIPLLFEASYSSDLIAKQVLQEYFADLGEICIDIMNVFRPDAIILGGGVSEQGERLAQPVRQYCAERHYGFGTGVCPVKVLSARLGNSAGLVGAAALWMEE